MMAYKPIVIPVSFKTTDLDDKLLLDWLEDKFRSYGNNKSAYIKSILREKMKEELEEK